MALKRLVGCVLFMLISAVRQCSSIFPPGKPIVKPCRSLDKETFTCWWEPSNITTDGEETTYRLFYEIERTNGIFECPDYHTAGKNSCFFDKKHTVLWVDYFLTVVAVNAFGNTTSNIYKFEVWNIVKPNPPENVTLQLEFSEDIPTINVTWNPYNIGPKFGWITLKYELRFKKKDSSWIIKSVGTQTHFSLYPSPGKLYMVQIRCAVDNGAWSEWSNTVFIQVPKSESSNQPSNSIETKQQPFWILVSFFSTIPFFAAVSLFFIKREIIKQWLLPPVPGPKIRGVDVQLLKNSKCGEVTGAFLISQVYLPGEPWTKHAEEYVSVCDDNMRLIEDQKHTNGMMISTHFHPNPKINSELNTYDIVQSKEKQTMLGYLVDTSKFGLVNELKYVDTMQTEDAQDKISIVNANPVENSSYVDIQKQEEGINHTDYCTVKDSLLLSGKQKCENTDIKTHVEKLPYNYTRVKEVNSDNTAVLYDVHDEGTTQTQLYIQ